MSAMPNLTRVLRRLSTFPWRNTVHTLRTRFRDDHLGLTASSLTFTTTIALVPFFTVVLAATSLVDAQACLPSLARVRGAAERGALAPPGDGIDVIEGGSGSGGSGGEGGEEGEEGEKKKKNNGGGSVVVALVATAASTSTSSSIPTSDGALALANVSFSYPSRPRVPIFRDFSLEIPAGKSTAITGGSGCGKSTAVALLARFYDPLRGAVTLDGRDVRTLDVNWYRSQFALVSQEPVLFSGTVFDNVREREGGEREMVLGVFFLFWGRVEGREKKEKKKRRRKNSKPQKLKKNFFPLEKKKKLTSSYSSRSPTACPTPPSTTSEPPPWPPMPWDSSRTSPTASTPAWARWRCLQRRKRGAAAAAARGATSELLFLLLLPRRLRRRRRRLFRGARGSAS